MSDAGKPEYVYIVTDSDGDPDVPMGVFYDRDKAVTFAKECVDDWKDPDEYEDQTESTSLEYLARYDCEDHTVGVSKCRVTP